MSDEPVGCAKPTGAVIGGDAEPASENSEPNEREKNMILAKVGAKAPDFEAPAYQNGNFINVKLSDYLGKWVILCFYPGDFTFV